MEKGFDPKKPFLHENGDGCDDDKTKCFSVSISEIFSLALAPHKIKTTLLLTSLISLTMRSVIVVQPIFE